MQRTAIYAPRTVAVAFAALLAVLATANSAPAQNHGPPAPLPEPVERLPRPGPLSADAPLALADLEDIAEATHPTLVQASVRVEAARGNWVQVGLPINPRIGYMANEIGDDGRQGMQGGFIGKEFVTAHKRAIARQEAYREVERAEQEYAAQRFRVLTDVRIGYYDVLFAQRRMEIAQDLVGVGNRAVDAADALLKAKEARLTDLLQARTETELARLALDTARYQHQAAWRQLAAVVGHPRMEPRPLTGDISVAAERLEWPATLERVLVQSPEIAVAAAELERARWALRRACAERHPNIDVELGVLHNNGSGDTVADVRVGVELPIFDRNQGAIRQARAVVVVAERDLDRLELELQHRLATVFSRYETSRQHSDRYLAVIIPNAKSTLDLAAAGYRAGEFGFLDFLTAQRTYFQANLAYLESARETWIASLEIEGLLMRDSLSMRK
jgi:cobalt-zinc-cadmium efflux system outer membrane protein